jgi:hypothetical protein
MFEVPMEGEFEFELTLLLLALKVNKMGSNRLIIDYKG